MKGTTTMTAEHDSAPDTGTLMTPKEVAALFRVHASTVVRWAGRVT